MNGFIPPSIDLARFQELKEKGAVRLQNLGGSSFQLIAKRYDPSTGQEIEPLVMPLNASQIQREITQLDTNIEQLTQKRNSLIFFLTEIKATETPTP